jgi:predicted nuclease of predicted toxin-antitoxin system
MKILIDMNLPPSWVEVFIAEGWEASLENTAR